MNEVFNQLLASIALMVVALSNLTARVILEYPLVLVGGVVFFIGYRFGRR